MRIAAHLRKLRKYKQITFGIAIKRELIAISFFMLPNSVFDIDVVTFICV